MSDNCIMELVSENLLNCPNEELTSGLSEVSLFYAPTAHIKKLQLPAQSGELADIVKITSDIETYELNKFGRINALVNENELTSSITGNAGVKKDSTSLVFYLPGMKDVNKGFVKRYKNVPMTFIAVDRAGVKHVIGTMLNPAYMDTADGTTGRTTEDNTGYAITVTAASFCYTLTGSFPGEDVSLPTT